MVSELGNVLKSGYYGSALGNNNVEWVADEVIKVEKKCFFFKKKH